MEIHLGLIILRLKQPTSNISNLAQQIHVKHELTVLTNVKGTNANANPDFR